MNDIKSIIHYDMNTLITILSNEKFDKIAILTDENTSKFCLPLITEKIPDYIEICIPSGEFFKSIETCQIIWKKLLDNDFSRKSILINLGGGVITDMGTFVASVYKRGIDCINIPTTLLAMVDASIGGKTGIDFFQYKNIIGSFYTAKSTIIDAVFLKTLSNRQLISGYVEMLKHGLIADSNYFNELIREDVLTIKNWNKLIKQSIDIKSSIVLKDPNEKNLRKILNLGHTIGHALESYFMKSDNILYHGEAILFGMIAELVLAEKYFNYQSKLIPLLENFAITYLGASKLKFDKQQVIDLLKNDKKNHHNQILFVLIDSNNHINYDYSCEVNEIIIALNYIHE